MSKKKSPQQALTEVMLTNPQAKQMIFIGDQPYECLLVSACLLHETGDVVVTVVVPKQI